LADSGKDFRDGSVSQALQARRAERLVLALDRLVAALPEAEQTAPLKAALKKLFDDAQSLQDFKPAEFAAHLEQFQKLIPASKP
ncbi:MAG TPA: hypothetical protein VN516_04120, partial [Candidatus Baltobacteraceae bacterium]|nr:hypothetical protein [Candidatus Baltobacteraceae bacterium]